MHVGIYADGCNVYYSGRRWFGRGVPGWRWLSPRALATTLVGQRRNWTRARVDRVVYCTARVDAFDNPAAYVDQDVYLKALMSAGAVDHIEFGRYVTRTKQVPLAEQPSIGRPRLARPPLPFRSSGLPLTLSRDQQGREIVLATALVREEKGSDVNVAAHLLLGVLSGTVDAAVLISNNSTSACLSRSHASTFQ